MRGVVHLQAEAGTKHKTASFVFIEEPVPLDHGEPGLSSASFTSAIIVPVIPAGTIRGNQGRQLGYLMGERRADTQLPVVKRKFKSLGCWFVFVFLRQQ